MNLNSPVKILSQEVKTPLVRVSGMRTRSSTAEVKRKAGPDALTSPDAKKRATTGLPKRSTQEDKTPLEGTGLPKKDKGVLQEELRSFLPLGKAYLGDDDKEVYEYDTNGPDDVETLKEVVALVHDRSSDTYRDRCELIEKWQLSLQKRVKDRNGYVGKLHVTVVLYEGRFGFGGWYGWL